MMQLGTGATIGLGLMLLVVIGGGVAALFVGLRTRAAAAMARDENARLHATLRSAPALAMLVRPDGRIEMPTRLADWL